MILLNLSALESDLGNVISILTPLTMGSTKGGQGFLERGAAIFFIFLNIFPIPQSFRGRFLKIKERWKPTGALSADRKYVGARSANASKGRNLERK